MKSFILWIDVAAFVFVMMALTNKQQEDPWKVPEQYKALKNPVKADELSISSGRELYTIFCVSCHGNDGKGFGKKGLKLDNTPTDFTTPSFQSHPDGSFLYVIYTGHREMPGFRKKLLPASEEVSGGTFGKTRNPGDLVNYLRTFGK